MARAIVGAALARKQAIGRADLAEDVEVLRGPQPVEHAPGDAPGHEPGIGEGAVIRNAILDKNVIVPEGAQIGVDLDRDRKLYTVSDAGVVVVGKGQQVDL